MSLSSFGGLWKDVAQVEGWNAEPKNESNPYGEVKKGAWIKIHGPLARLRLSTIGTTEHEIRLRRVGSTPYPRFCTPWSKDEVGTVISLDYAEIRKSTEILQHWDLQVILMMGIKWRKDNETRAPDEDKGATSESHFDLMYGLVVRTSESDEEEGNRLVRVGWMHINGDEGHRIIKDETSWKSVTLI